jgi:hypothetical protein
MKKLRPLNLKNVKTYPLKERTSKVSVKDFGSSWASNGSMGIWFNKLPNILAGSDFKKLVTRLTVAVKVGLSPIILDLMESGIITGLAMNGAGIIHDLEVAMVGGTSEDVDSELVHGRFGMAKETGEFLNKAIKEGAKKGEGLGASVGRSILKASFPYNKFSLSVGAARMNIPLTVHVAMGTDIIHFHPAVDGSAIGKTSHFDFRVFAAMISQLEGGAYINLGSAVILPEVFLKALTLVRNLGFNIKEFTTLDMDFIKHYRPMTNVVKRPTLEGGVGFSLTGHNEIMFPLLAAALIENLDNNIFS